MRNRIRHPAPRSAAQRLAATLSSGLIVILLVSSLAPLLQGCGQDLVIGGDLVIPTVIPSPSPTP